MAPYSAVYRNGVVSVLEECRHGHPLEKVAVGRKSPGDQRVTERIELLFPPHLMKPASAQQAPDELKIMRPFDNEVGILHEWLEPHIKSTLVAQSVQHMAIEPLHMGNPVGCFQVVAHDPVEVLGLSLDHGVDGF